MAYELSSSTTARGPIFANSFLKTEEALGHSSTLRELGASLESELEPSIVDLQDRSVTLTGTVDDQYQEWRRILGEMFRLEEGLPETSELGSDGQASNTDATAPASR